MDKFKFFGGGEKMDSGKDGNLKAENEKLIEENNKLKLQISALQSSTEKGNNVDFELYKENAIFAPELKPYAEKALGLMKMGHELQAECYKLYTKEKNNTVAVPFLNKAFAKFQRATYGLEIGELHEQLNNIAYNNGILVKPPAEKANNHSFVYATIRQAIQENRSEEQRIESFQEDINIGLLNRYAGALLVLVEDMKVLAENKFSIPKEIYELRETLRLQITKELGLKISDIALLEKLNGNIDIEVIDEVDSPLTEGKKQIYGQEQVVEVLFYGVGRGRVDKTKVIIGK